MSAEGARFVRYLLAHDAEAMLCLSAVAGLGLRDCWIAAGFVRNRVWDRLHGYAETTPLNDIDVIFHDPADRGLERESEIEAALARICPGRPFEVRNQARMHEKSGDPPYPNTETALRSWMETPTTVAARLDTRGDIEFLHPFGMGDLLAMTVRPTPRWADHLDQFDARMARKRWPEIWPRVQILRSP